ncbi:MAG: patatin-like phospholipase family protein [Pseudomonadota bacterium]
MSQEEPTQNSEVQATVPASQEKITLSDITISSITLFLMIALSAALLSAFLQDQLWSFLKEYLIATLVIATAVSIVSDAKKLPFGTFATLLAGLIVLYFLTIGVWKLAAFDIALYTLAVVVAVLAAWGLIHVLYQPIAAKHDLANRLTPRAQNAVASMGVIVVSLAAWAAASMVTVWTQLEPLPKDNGRFSNLGPTAAILPERAKKWADRRIGIALSGGGYRAAVFHAGVLTALEDIGVQPSALSTVSGGSIVGAYYQQGGAPADFKQAMLERRFNIKRDLLSLHNLLRLPLPLSIPGSDLEILPMFRFSRLDVQAGAIDKLIFDGDDTTARNPGQPEIMMAATEINYGLKLGFLSDGIVVSSRNWSRVYRGAAFAPEEQFSPAHQVAISGAFPVAFPTVAWSIFTEEYRQTLKGPLRLSLADGGLADNTGTDLFNAARIKACSDPEACNAETDLLDHSTPPAWSIDALIVSDAGAIFGVEQDSSAVDALIRGFDIAAAGSDYESVRHRVTIAPRALHIPSTARWTHEPSLTGHCDKEATITTLSEDAPERRQAACWRLSFALPGIPAALLERIIDRLPIDERETLKGAVAPMVTALSELTPEEQKVWRKRVARADPDDCQEPLPGVCEGALLKRHIRAWASNALDVFQTTSTLEDQFEAERVETLYALGEVLTYLQFYRIERQMTGQVTPPGVPTQSSSRS